MKPNYSLIPPTPLLNIANVLTHGAKKHGDFTYAQGGENLGSQITKALRHIQEWRMGRVVDDESGESPLAHAAARLIIALSIIAKEDTWSDGPQRTARVEEATPRAEAERKFTTLISKGGLPKTL